MRPLVTDSAIGKASQPVKPLIFCALNSCFCFFFINHKKKVVGVVSLSRICYFVTGTSSGSSSCRCTSFGELRCLWAGKAGSGRLSCWRAADRGTVQFFSVVLCSWTLTQVLNERSDYPSSCGLWHHCPALGNTSPSSCFRELRQIILMGTY